jgi:hypothetical protein
MFGCPLNTDDDDGGGEEHVRQEPPPPDIGQAEAEAGLRQAVIRLSAHVGYHTAKVYRFPAQVNLFMFLSPFDTYILRFLLSSY